jgi:hypothetical protein
LNVQRSSEDEASRGGEGQKMADEEARVKAEDWTVRTVRFEGLNARDEMESSIATCAGRLGRRYWKRLRRRSEVRLVGTERYRSALVLATWH